MESGFHLCSGDALAPGSPEHGAKLHHTACAPSSPGSGWPYRTPQPPSCTSRQPQSPGLSCSTFIPVLRVRILCYQSFFYLPVPARDCELMRTPTGSRSRYGTGTDKQYVEAVKPGTEQNQRGCWNPEVETELLTVLLSWQFWKPTSKTIWVRGLWPPHFRCVSPSMFVKISVSLA